MTPEQLAARVLANCPRYDSDGDPSGQFDHKIFVKETEALTAIARHLAPGDDLVERLLARKGRGGGFKHTVEDGVNVLTHEPAPDPLCQEAAARLSALTADRDQGAQDYCKLMDRHDDLHNENARLRARLAGMEAAADNAIANLRIGKSGAQIMQALLVLERARAALTDGGSNG